MPESRPVCIDSGSEDLRLILCQAFAQEHGAPLAFFDPEDQHDWDAKAQEVLREMATALGQEGRHA